MKNNKPKIYFLLSFIIKRSNIPLPLTTFYQTYPGSYSIKEISHIIFSIHADFHIRMHIVKSVSKFEAEDVFYSGEV